VPEHVTVNAERLKVLVGVVEVVPVDVMDLNLSPVSTRPAE
jgi:hypothetical protein